MCVCIHVCVYIYIERERERETRRLGDARCAGVSRPSSPSGAWCRVLEPLGPGGFARGESVLAVRPNPVGGNPGPPFWWGEVR